MAGGSGLFSTYAAINSLRRVNRVNGKTRKLSVPVAHRYYLNWYTQKKDNFSAIKSGKFAQYRSPYDYKNFMKKWEEHEKIKNNISRFKTNKNKLVWKPKGLYYDPVCSGYLPYSDLLKNKQSERYKKYFNRINYIRYKKKSLYAQDPDWWKTYKTQTKCVCASQIHTDLESAHKIKKHMSK